LHASLSLRCNSTEQNISQANSDNFLTDLNMTTNDFNNGQTIFYLAFLAAELPSQLISKRLGPDVWIPIQMVCWSLVATFQCFLSGRSSFFVCRALLGLFEGGFIPDTILYLSYFYKGQELPRRLSWFWTADTSTNILAAFIAFGVLRLRGSGPSQWAGWRYLFLIEGLLTFVVGVWAFFYMQPSVAQKARGLPRNMFSEKEQEIMVTRVIRDDPSKGTMHNREALSWTYLKESLLDYDMWPLYLIAFSFQIPTAPPTAYLTLILRNLGFGTFDTNLLTIPSSVLFILQMLLYAWFSEWINERILVCMGLQLYTLPLLIAIICLPQDMGQWVRYVLLTLLIGYPYIHPIQVALQSRNAGSVRTRTVASAVYNMFCQASSVVSSQIYRANDAASYYRNGNIALLAVNVVNVFLYLFAKWYYVNKNKKRDEKWRAMTPEEREEYIRTTTDKGNKRLDFRFAH